MAEIDDVKAVKTARAVTKAKRILSEDVIWDQKLKEMSNFYMTVHALAMYTPFEDSPRLFLFYNG